ncbi:hypothetical protein [Nonomuraea sp. NPDC001699]
MHRLKRWNTPTVHNGWEQITQHDITFHQEESRDFMPQMVPMAGRAVTVGSFRGEVDSSAHGGERYGRQGESS